MNITGSFETQAVSPKWFAEVVMELEGAIERLEFDTGGQLNLASAPGATRSCLRLVSGRHLAPGSRYNVMSLEPDKPTQVSDLEIRHWNARNIEIALTVTETDVDLHALLEVERGSRYGIRVVTLNVEAIPTPQASLSAHSSRRVVEMAARWQRTVWKVSLDVEKWFKGHHGALTGDVSHRAGFGRLSVTPTSNGSQWTIKVDILVRGRGLFRPLAAILLRMFRSRLQKGFDTGMKMVESELAQGLRALDRARQEDPSAVAQQIHSSTVAQQLLAAWLCGQSSLSVDATIEPTEIDVTDPPDVSITRHNSPDVSHDDTLFALHTLGGTRLVWDAYPVGDGRLEIGGLHLEDMTGRPVRFGWAARSCEDDAYALANRYSAVPGRYVLALPTGTVISAPSRT